MFLPKLQSTLDHEICYLYNRDTNIIGSVPYKVAALAGDLRVVVVGYSGT